MPMIIEDDETEKYLKSWMNMLEKIRDQLLDPDNLQEKIAIFNLGVLYENVRLVLADIEDEE